ncbi:hypothetical protein VaNZ11_012887 [Volvox africanus]|uniref:6-phosphofructo-2-kinase domain-containing protein n=1 Tax=Volvox africanus TaxID=51714 RepID=A0ABQ5SEW4_9CHLO|nr:hypothetical protein VaNZ11_012887 [Volvox africanus]
MEVHTSTTNGAPVQSPTLATLAPTTSPSHGPPQLHQHHVPSPLGRRPMDETELRTCTGADDALQDDDQLQPPQPALACRSAPISACTSASNSSHTLLRTAVPTGAGSLHGATFHVASGTTAIGGGPFGRASFLPSTAHLIRRLRGLVMSSAVNFRDVDLMPPPPSDDDLGLMEDMDQQGEEPDADAATGSTVASVVPIDSSLPSLIGNADAGGGLAGGEEGDGGGAGGYLTATRGSGLEGAGGGGGLAGDAGGISSGWASCVGGGRAAAPARTHPAAAQGTSRIRTSGALVRKNKLVIIMVGLPGRGKTFLCNKLCCYLNWLGHATRHFNVGSYRRRQKLADELQDAQFFDHANEAGQEARHRALSAALEDLRAWLRSDAGQVAVFDATNTTESRRNLLRSNFQGQWQYLFIETICSDPAVLEQNYRNKMKYSPDYKGVDTEQAVADFLARISKYEEVYEPINNRNLHYIKLIDMVTGRGYMDINRISGYLPGKIVFFLMQICKAGMTSVRKIWLSRHGESEYNQKGLIGGNSSLSNRGELYSRALREALIARLPQEEPVSVAVWTSTLKRTIETARFLPFPKLRWKALDEIDAGICDGMTYEQIAEQYPQEFEMRKKDKLRYRYPSGESYMDVIQRVEPVIIELERERECVLVVAHQAVLRAVYAYFMNVPPEDIPRLSMPLHTLIELTPMPDGTMSVQRFPVDIDQDFLTTEIPCGSTACVGLEGVGGIRCVGGGSNDAEDWQALERFPSSAPTAAELLAASGSSSPLSSSNGIATSVHELVGSMVLPASPAPRPPPEGNVIEGTDLEPAEMTVTVAAAAGEASYNC